MSAVNRAPTLFLDPTRARLDFSAQNRSEAMRARSRGNVQPSAAAAFPLPLVLSLLCLALACGSLPQHHRWESIQLSLIGPPSQSLSEDNPFAVRLDVVFRSPDTRNFLVPGFPTRIFSLQC